jgi:predicted O-methyltransferase YrrM
MAITTKIKEVLNAALAQANLRIDSLSAERAEMARLEGLCAAGHFIQPVFPVLPSFEKSSARIVFENLPQHRARFEDLQNAGRNRVGYAFDNDYFSSPDTEVLYTLVRQLQPRQVVEVGSGNSTRITRQAIADGALATKLISIDPAPRREVAEFCDESFRERVEGSGALTRLRGLQAGDFLFIDSSHEVKTGNDVVFLLLNVLPQLPAGVVIHIHDIFLPFEYPENWVRDFRWGWTEQYLVQAMLAFSDAFETIWPGHYLQRTQPNFAQHFPHLNGRTAYSLWLRKVK